MKLSSIPSSPVTPDASSAHKAFDSFQRGKVGSIRDNPKLCKIRQRFESACQENQTDDVCKSSPKNIVSPSFSAPCSLNFIFPSTKDHKTALRNVREVSTSHSDANEPRRHSEGEVGARVFNYPLRRTHNRVNSLGDCKLSSRHDSGNFSIATEDGECSSDELNKDSSVAKGTVSNNNIIRNYSTLKPPPPTIKEDYKKCSKYSYEKSSYSPPCAAVNSAQYEVWKSRDPNTLTNSKPYSTISKVIQDSQKPATVDKVPAQKTSFKDSSSAEKPPMSPTGKAPTVAVKKNSVRNAVRLYEEMSCRGRCETPASTNQSVSSAKRTVPAKNSTDCVPKRSCVIRRSSRRNSVRKSKSAVARSDSKKSAISPVRKKVSESVVSNHKHLTEDSGLGMSDTDEQNRSNNAQGIYQTLCGINHARNFDPYDRLNRIHDMVSRIHKGQLATCAACKAIPSNTLRYVPVAGTSMLQVRCNEVLPHHHPPCVCFACQHSIFSCAQPRVNQDDGEHPESSLEYLSISDSSQSLYYNACCLEDTPSPETWRLARRKPVCERNGRVCVVNCGVDQSAMVSDDFYEKLSEWQSAPLTSYRRSQNSVERASSRLFSGDSCDSDEGWVDITDSEEEKNLYGGEHSHRSCGSRCRNSFRKVCRQHSRNGNGLDNASYALQANIHEPVHGGNNISRVSSSEHLYETISDIEEQNRKLEMSKEQEGSALMNGETALDNEHDSGEWSTESPSPTLDETCDACEEEKCLSFPSNTCPATRFTLSCELEAQESKSTFIKNMLGRKTISPKKRRMSNFFVPWLVSNQEYGSSSSQNSKSSSLKKQNMRAKRMDSSPPKAKRSFTKTKRSQSVPSKSCDKTLYSPTGKTKCSEESVASVDTGEADETNSVEHLSVSRENLHSISQSNSFTSASSTYVRSDQLKCNSQGMKPVPCVSPEAAPVDVSVERVRWRSLSGDSDHSYILFQPIKEEDVPLYQFYERNIKERVALCRSPDSFSPIMWPSMSESNSSHDCGHKSPAVRSQLSVIEQLSPDTMDGKMLWCELPEVKDSGILGRISAQELKLQEAVFELIQSQASYVRSLKVLYEYFILSPEFSETQSSRCVLSKHEHDVLFSDIIQVKEVSEMLMTELTARWSDGILIPDICDILYKHSTMTGFSVYVKYCSNRVYQEKTLKELKETRLCFMEVLRKLESNPACQGLSLESFLFLPMQHIARLPLLLDSIFRWLTSESPSYNICRNALEAVHKTFMECNEGAKKMERLEEMLVLNKQLEFKECKAIPLISTSRWLLKKGEMVKLEFDKKTFGRSSRCVRIPLYFFLFNDFIVITKRKSEDCYIVVDYCQKDKIQASTIDAKDLPQSVLVPNTCRYLIHLTLLCNHQGSTVDMILNCPLLSERTRWIEAIHPVPQGSIHEVWDYDCPQVQCVRTYIAQQPDELSLQESDVVTIQRKMNDGWYEGRRLRDGLQGWFPASYTMDIPCSRARASNLRQCYRLLMLSQKHHGKC